MNSRFLELLQPFPFTDTVQLDEESLLYCEDLATKHNVWMLLYVQLQHYLKEAGEDEIIRTFLQERKPLFLQHVALSMSQQVVEKEVLSLLEASKIPAIVLKGSVIACDIYKNPNSRSSCDIDILIKISDAECVDAILTGAGYSRMDSTPLAFLQYRLHHATYLHERFKKAVEIHWNFSIPGFFELTSEQIWNNVKYSEESPPQLTSEMTIIMLLMHHHMHAFKQLRNTVDMYWALHVYENRIDWHALTTKLQEIGLLKAAKITINQIQQLWEEQSKKLHGLQILDRKIMNISTVPNFLLDYFSINIEEVDSVLHKKDKLFFRLALDRWTNIIFSFTKTFFPAPRVIKVLYDDPSNTALLFNYFKFIKWRTLDRKK